MKPSILLLAFVALAISSCTTAYKTGQTPDDVYYSPARPGYENNRDEYVRIEERDDRSYRYDEEYYDDRYLRMKVRNRNRWSDLDDWYFYGKRYSYAYSYNSPWGYSWNPYTSWNYYYNPYCRSCCITSGVKTGVVYNKPRNFNLNAYSPASSTKGKLFGTNNVSNTYSSPRTNSVEKTEKGNFLRDLFGTGNSSSGSSGSSSSSTKSNSGSSGSSGSSGGASKAPVRKF